MGAYRTECVNVAANRLRQPWKFESALGRASQGCGGRRGSAKPARDQGLTRIFLPMWCSNVAAACRSLPSESRWIDESCVDGSAISFRPDPPKPDENHDLTGEKQFGRKPPLGAKSIKAPDCSVPSPARGQENQPRTLVDPEKIIRRIKLRTTTRRRRAGGGCEGWSDFAPKKIAKKQAEASPSSERSAGRVVQAGEGPPSARQNP